MSRVQIPTARTVMTLQQAQTDCLRYLLAVKGDARSTVDNVGRVVDQYRAFLRGQGLQDSFKAVNGDTVFGFIGDLGERGCKASTLCQKLSSLRTFFRYCRRLKSHTGAPLLANDPTEDFDWPTAQHQETPFLYPQEYEAFRALPLELRDSVTRAVLLSTGLRNAEVCRLTVGDYVQFGGARYLLVIGKGRRSRERKRHVPLPNWVVTLIDEWLQMRGNPIPTERLLLSPRGIPYTSYALIGVLRRWGVKAGIVRFRLTPHKLRHTRAVHARIAGLDPYTRAQLMGHTSVRSMERYEHLVPMELLTAQERVEQQAQAYGALEPPVQDPQQVGDTPASHP